MDRSDAFNQHRPAPFVPVTKHRVGEPASPAAAKPMTRAQAQSQSEWRGSPSRADDALSPSAGPSSSALRPLSYENVPLSAVARTQTPPPKSPALSSGRGSGVDIAATSPAPRIRAKLTPAATPRRKAVDGIYPSRTRAEGAWPNRLTDLPDRIPASEASVFAPPSPARIPTTPSSSSFSSTSSESVVVCVR